MGVRGVKSMGVRGVKSMGAGNVNVRDEPLWQQDGEKQDIPIADIIRHPGFSPNTLDDDIAILRLEWQAQPSR